MKEVNQLEWKKDVDGSSDCDDIMVGGKRLVTISLRAKQTAAAMGKKKKKQTKNKQKTKKQNKKKKKGKKTQKKDNVKKKKF